MNLRKKLILAVALLNIVGLSQAMEKKEIVVKLPPASTLNQRLNQIGLKHYLEETGIDKKLGDQEKYPKEVAQAVEHSLRDYSKNVGNPMLSRIMQLRKPVIIKAILQDSPEAITQLEETGLLTKTNK